MPSGCLIVQRRLASAFHPLAGGRESSLGSTSLVWRRRLRGFRSDQGNSVGLPVWNVALLHPQPACRRVQGAYVVPHEVPPNQNLMEKLSHKTDVPQGFQVPHGLLVWQSYRGPSVHEHAAPCFTHRALHNRGFDLRGPYDNDGKSSLSTAYLGCALIAGENLALPADVAHSAAWPTTPALSLSLLPPASLLGRRSLCNCWSVARQQFLQLLQQLREVSPAYLRVVTAAAADPVTSLSATSFSTEETLALSVVIALTTRSSCDAI
ncbi:hypothetical protein T09_13716 [Trichinella sp. T9]|nr:hypothetical protein T09_13716 [Trichinella sp. T9]